jgi:RNA polymerase sigma-70 factor (ECF subfamily)
VKREAARAQPGQKRTDSASNARPMNLPTLLATHRSRADAAAPATPDLASALCAEAPRLRRLVHRLLGWRARAGELDDVVQDVLLKAWRHQRSFRGDAALSTWLTRIAIHQVHDHVRKANLRRTLFGWLLPEPPAPADGDDDGSGGDAPAGDGWPRTQRAMQRLAHADREVLVLRYLEQRDIPEIAGLLGCSRAALDARLSRARTRLRAELGLEGA